MKQPTPSAEQIAALNLFAAANGRSWKAALRDLWMSGAYNYAVLGGAEPSELQTLRNSFGPSWLVSFSLKKANEAAEAAAEEAGLQKYSNVWHYLNAEQYFAENRRDFRRSGSLLDAIRLLQACRSGIGPEWLAAHRAFIARHPELQEAAQ